MCVCVCVCVCACACVCVCVCVCACVCAHEVKIYHRSGAFNNQIWLFDTQSWADWQPKIFLPCSLENSISGDLSLVIEGKFA